MPDALCIILLAGGRNSGKTKTLRRIEDRDLKRVAGRVYSFKGKKIFVYLSSPQEQLGEFCRFNKVISIMREKIKKCALAHCAILLIPFTMGMNRAGTKLNTRCIEEPIKRLREDGHDVQVVYLRREFRRNVEFMDDLMKRLGSSVIKSNGQWNRQADELLKTLT